MSQLDEDEEEFGVGGDIGWVQFKRGDGVMVIRLHILLTAPLLSTRLMLMTIFN